MRTLRFATCFLALSACGPSEVLSLKSDRATAQANGADAVTLTATVKWNGAAPKAGVTVHFSAASPGVLSAASSVTDANGEATTRLTSLSAESILVHAVLADPSTDVSTSIAFTVATVNRLRFSTSPGSTGVDNLVRPVPVVVIEDAAGNPTTSTATVTVRITTGSCAAALDASSLVSVAASNGSASFYGLKSSTAATGCTLTATSGSFTPATSTAFSFL